jgi:hypothetical protein
MTKIITQLSALKSGFNNLLNAISPCVRGPKKEKSSIGRLSSTIGSIFLAGLSLVLMDSRIAQAAPPSGYMLVFDEEFNGPLDVAPGTGWAAGHKWTAHTPYDGDFGSAYFTGPSENKTTPDPFSIFEMVY